MTNLQATKALCNAIASSFFPDDSAVEIMLVNKGIEADAEYIAGNADVLRVSISLVMGYVEGSRSEGGVSVSVRSEEAIKNSIRYYCGVYGLDFDEEMAGYVRTIKDGTNLW
jgi:hypothetical protein